MCALRGLWQSGLKTGKNILCENPQAPKPSNIGFGKGRVESPFDLVFYLKISNAVRHFCRTENDVLEHPNGTRIT